MNDCLSEKCVVKRVPKLLTLLSALPPGTIPITRVETSRSRDSTGAVVNNNSNQFIFVKYNTNYNHLKTFDMVINQDEPMDSDPNIPPGGKPPDCSPANRERSASPQARANRPSRRGDPHGWTYNHMLGILQHCCDMVCYPI